MPTVRDDLRICQSYRPSGEPPLPCPLHIFGGHNDPLLRRTRWPPGLVIRRSRNRFVSSPATTFCSVEPDPQLVTAVARVVEDVALERI